MSHAIELNHSLKPSVLVTGSSGYLGSHLIEKLKDTNVRVSAFFRNKIPNQNQNIVPISGDLLDAHSIEGALNGIHTVVHLAWDRHPSDSSFSESPNVIMLKNLIQSMERLHIARMIFISAVGASRDGNTPFLKEKYLCEQLLINSSIKEKIIIRCAVLFGGETDGGFITAVKSLMGMPLIYPVPMGDMLMSPLHVNDVCEFISKCIFVKMYDYCAIADLVGGEAYRLSQIFKIVNKRLGKNLIPVGSFLGNYLTKIIERKFSKQEPKISDYFFVGGRVEKKIRLRNPLTKLLPEKCLLFQDVFTS